MYFMSDPQALHVTRNVIPGKLGVDLHLHRVHIPLVEKYRSVKMFYGKRGFSSQASVATAVCCYRAFVLVTVSRYFDIRSEFYPGFHVRGV